MCGAQIASSSPGGEGGVVGGIVALHMGRRATESLVNQSPLCVAPAFVKKPAPDLVACSKIVRLGMNIKQFLLVSVRRVKILLETFVFAL